MTQSAVAFSHPTLQTAEAEERFMLLETSTSNHPHSQATRQVKKEEQYLETRIYT